MSNIDDQSLDKNQTEICINRKKKSKNGFHLPLTF